MCSGVWPGVSQSQPRILPGHRSREAVERRAEMLEQANTTALASRGIEHWSNDLLVIVRRDFTSGADPVDVAWEIFQSLKHRVALHSMPPSRTPHRGRDPHEGPPVNRRGGPGRRTASHRPTG